MITMAVLFVAYWLPTLLAFHRRHRSRAAILIVNFLLGWTLIGWVAALIWAGTGNTEPATFVVYR
jgi:hypothetical protein